MSKFFSAIWVSPFLLWATTSGAQPICTGAVDRLGWAHGALPSFFGALPGIRFPGIRPEATLIQEFRISLQALISADRGAVDSRTKALDESFRELKLARRPALFREALLRAADALGYHDHHGPGVFALVDWLIRTDRTIGTYASAEPRILNAIQALKTRASEPMLASPNGMVAQRARAAAFQLLIATGARLGFSRDAIEAIDSATPYEKATLIRATILASTPRTRAIMAAWAPGVRWQLAFARADVILAGDDAAAARGIAESLRDLSDGPFGLSLNGLLSFRSASMRDGAFADATALQNDLRTKGPPENSFAFQMARLIHLVYAGLRWDIVDSSREERPWFFDPATDLLLATSARGLSHRLSIAPAIDALREVGREPEWTAVDRFLRDRHVLSAPYGGLQGLASVIFVSGERLLAPSPRFSDALLSAEYRARP